ncbi:MAG TPA: GH92 family glycosyl hydrolase [Acidobacteriaceae bacterium]|jgi:predicted alpha-1,2-mannosidase|nr:GH92 family glycosyl hydrolase [Acidobacteriaceae bacterium]
MGVLCVFAFLCVVAGLHAAIAQQLSPYESVDPIIGTAGGGNTFPGATLPFGMIQWSPDTGPDAWYDYGKKLIYGFSLTHISGAGCPVYGDFPVLPWPGELTVSPHANRELYTQPFDHSNESAHPGDYALTLANGIRVEMTVTDQAGIARFTFPTGVPARLLINAGGSANSTVVDKKPNDPARANDGYTIRIEGPDAVSGEARAGNFCGSRTRYTLYMSAQFDHPTIHTTMWKDDTVDVSAREENARHAGALLDFGDQRTVTMKVALSFVSAKSAKFNLDQEFLGRGFDAIRANAQQTWSELLSRFDVQGGTQEQRTIFYTGIYHTLLSPNLFSDQNGQYTGFDDKVHHAGLLPGTPCAGICYGAQYANFSDWDIYRDVIQLHALLDPDRASYEAQSLVNDAEQSGWLPRWPAANDVTYVMGGDSPTVLLADAYAFGATRFDSRTALEYMLKAADQPGTGPHGDAERPYVADELKLGYVPVDKDRIAASRSLEYASDDFAIAQFARALGDAAGADALTKRAGNWQNLLDPDSKWIRPRNADGSWQSGFDALHSQPRPADAPLWVGPLGFEEGNSPQYSFMIPFDYARLIPAMGGDAVVVPRLDSFFSKLICWGEPCFNMANEPDFVVPYTYEYTDQPWKTDDVITRIEQQTFSTKPDGVPGNDDLGATSGVYVWNALGLYPGVPGVGGFFLGTPMFPQATVHFAGGRTLRIEREGQGVYVTAIALNGHPWNSYWLPLNKIPAQSTTTLRFTMQESAPSSTTFKAPPAFIPEH